MAAKWTAREMSRVYIEARRVARDEQSYYKAMRAVAAKCNGRTLEACRAQLKRAVKNLQSI